MQVNYRDNDNKNDLYYRYFVFSRDQREDIIRRGDQRGQKILIGKVIINGVAKEYTDVLIKAEETMYADAIVVAKGDIRKMQYTQHTNLNK